MLPPPCLTLGMVCSERCAVLVSATHSVLHLGQKVQFWSHLTRAPSSTCLLCPPHGFWQTANRTPYGFILIMAFLPFFHQGHICAVHAK